MSLDVSGSSSGCKTLPPCYQAVVGGQKAKWLFSQQCLDEEEATGPTNADGNIFPCLLSLVFSVL